MLDFILLTHNDSTSDPTPAMLTSYFATLNSKGIFEGGSSIGAGDTFRKDGSPGKLSESLVGYIRVRAKNLSEAREFLAGHPVFECGGTVEVRELPRG